MLSSFAHGVKAFIDRNRLLKTDGFYLLALSGGSDSVALFRVMIELGYRFAAVHCNFQLRGEESRRDELFCEQLCLAQKVPFHRVHFDTKTYAKLHRVSIEMAARELRYRYFEQLRKDLGADAILVAHHNDDSVETFLLNLIRGTGIHGLLGIKPKNGFIVRPLLSIGRSDIEAYLSGIGQAFVTDCSNQIANVKRNMIRLKVLPLLREINPSVSNGIASTAKRLGLVAQTFDKAMTESIAAVTSHQGADNCVIDIQQLKKETAPEYTLYSILKKYAFSSAQIESIACSLDAPSGRKWLSKSHELVVSRGQLIVVPLLQDANRSLSLPEPGRYVWDDVMRFDVALCDIPSDFSPSRSKNIVTLAADSVRFPLLVRHVHKGDRFRPLGMKGSKLVNDLLTDLKLSLDEKQRQLVVVDAADKIIWVVGRRIDDSVSVTSETTEILRLQVL